MEAADKNNHFTNFINNTVVINMANGTKRIGDLESRSTLSVSEARYAYEHVYAGISFSTLISKLPELDGVLHQPYVTNYQDMAVIEKNEKLYWNTYQPSNVQITDDGNLVHLFITLLNVVSGPNHTNWLLEWLSQMIQNPESGSSIAPLFISKESGCGYTMLLERILLPIVGIQNFETGSSDNLYFHRRNKKRMKKYCETILIRMYIYSEKEREIEFLNSTINDNKSYFILFVNNEHHRLTELKSTKPIINDKQPLDSSFYGELNNALETTNFIDQVYSFLLRYPIDDSAEVGK